MNIQDVASKNYRMSHSDYIEVMNLPSQYLIIQASKTISDTSAQNYIQKMILHRK